jgi:hypothetical protein
MFWAGGDLPVRTYATGTAADLTLLKVGHYELGSGGATATRAILPTPYPGARVRVVKMSSATGGEVFDAGASASDVSLDASDGAAGGGTGVTYDGTSRRILLQEEGEYFEVYATSASRWRLVGFHYDASTAGEGGSRFFGGGT